MTPFSDDRRVLLAALIVAPFGEIVRAEPAAAQTAAPLPPIVQPTERTKAGFLARVPFVTRPSRRGIKPMARWSSVTA